MIPSNLLLLGFSVMGKNSTFYFSGNIYTFNGNHFTSTQTEL